MKWRRLRWLALGWVVFPLWLASGCTNSDALNSGVNRYVVHVEVTNPETRFGEAGFLVNQLTVRPVDPTADEVLGTDPIALLASTEGGIDVDLNGTATTFEATSPLELGAYRLETLVLQRLLFQQGTPDANPMGCVGAIVDYTEVSIVNITDFGGDIILNVTLGSEGNEVRIVIDGATLADAFEESWNCGFGFPQCPLGTTICATSFNTFEFTALAPTFIQFE